MAIKELLLDSIRIDGGTQARAALNVSVVSEYADLMEDGKTFPPLIVYFDGKHNWLGDGFHRLHGYRKAGIGEAMCDVRKGTQRDALLFALGANAEHGLKRSNADKRKAVETLLNDEEWVRWSDGKLAEVAAVSQQFVSIVRKELTTVVSSPAAQSASEPRIGRDGKERKTPAPRPVPVVAEREPGDETEHETPSAIAQFFDRKPSSPADKKTHFDDSQFDKLMGPLVRFFHARAERKRCINCAEHNVIGDHLDGIKAAFEAWQKRIPA